MAGLPVISVGGLVSVDGTPLQSAGWTILEAISFIEGPSVQILNRPLVGGPSKKYPAIPAERKFNVGFLITGEYDGLTGEANSNPFDGLIRNCLNLRSLVFDPHDPVRTVTWTNGSDLTLTGPIQFDGSPPMGGSGLSMTTIETQLQIVLPEGSLS